MRFGRVAGTTNFIAKIKRESGSNGFPEQQKATLLLPVKQRGSVMAITGRCFVRNVRVPILNARRGKESLCQFVKFESLLSSKTAADAAASASNLHKLNKPNKLNKLFLILAAILACTPAVNASGAGADYAGFENTATYHLPALSIWAGLLLGGVMLLLALLLHFREPKPAKPQTWTFSDFLVLKLNPVPHHQPKSKD